MLRYVIALFLLNMHCRSLGAPTANIPSPSNALTDGLGTLAKNCGNPFITKQIESRIQNCSQAAVDKKKIFECLIFYDINSQLCYAINNSKIVINEDISAKVNQAHDVKDLCNTAKDWTFTKNYNLGVNLTTVFQDPATCIKICGVADVLSTDSIFFCKYYNWGWEKLKGELTSTSELRAGVVGTGGVSTSELSAGVVGTGGVSNQNGVSSQMLDQNANLLTPIVEKKDTSNNKDNTEQNKLSDVQESLSTNPASAKASTKSVTQSPSSASVSSADKETVNSNVGVADDQSSVTVKPTGTENKPSPPVKTTLVKDVKETPKLPDDTGNDDIDGIDGDGEDAEDSEDGEVVAAQTVIINNKDIRVDGGSFSSKEFLDNPPEDDHFFPFFLTSIILVVLLYILYHNKGKVTKVFLGLIVEGRQNGRRRNSRGHAYRRLDTLEQAMSGNLPAQPSKIIY